MFYHGDADDKSEDSLANPGNTGWLLPPHRDGSHQGPFGVPFGHAECEVPARLPSRAKQLGEQLELRK